MFFSKFSSLRLFFSACKSELSTEFSSAALSVTLEVKYPAACSPNSGQYCIAKALLPQSNASKRNKTKREKRLSIFLPHSGGLLLTSERRNRPSSYCQNAGP